VALIIAETEIRGMEGADLMVKADVQKYSTLDYAKSNELIAIGYSAAQEKAALLKPYELDDAAWADYVKEKESRVRTKIGVPQFVRVVGVEGDSRRNMEKFLSPLAGKPVDIKELDLLLTRLVGVGRYGSITYDLIEDNGKTGLLVRVNEKSYAPPTLRPGFEINGTQPDNVTFTFASRITAMDVAGFRSEWRTDFSFGETYGLRSELYRPFQPFGKWFFTPIAGASRGAFYIYNHNNPKADYRLDRAEGEFDVGYGISRFSEVRVGYGGGYADASLRLGTPDFNSYSGNIAALHARYIIDHTNEPVIPTQGYYLQSNFYYYNQFPSATQAFPTLEINAQYFQQVFKRDSIFIIGSGGSTFGYHNTGVPQFFLGGVGRLTAYGLNELLGNQYFVGRVGYLKKVFTLPPFVGRDVYVIGYGEVGKMYNDPLGAPKLSGDGAAGLLADTALGPMFIGGSVGDTGHSKWFFQLGRVF